MAPLDLTLVAGLWILFAAAATLLAAVILRERPDKRENLALAALLIQQAVATVLTVVLFTADQPNIAYPAFRVLVPVWLLWGPIVFLCGPLLLGPSAGRLDWGLGLAGALPPALLIGSGLLRPDVMIEPTRIAMTRLSTYVFFLVFLGFAVTVVLLSKEALTTDLPKRRAQFGLLAAAFSVEGGYHAASNVSKLALGLDFHGLQQPGLLLSAIAASPALVYGGLVVWLARTILRSDEENRRTWALRILCFLAAAAVTGAATADIAVAGTMQDPREAFHALWDLGALAMIFFAGMRFQLFGIERQAKRTVAISTAVTGGFLLFVVVQEAAEEVIAQQTILGTLPAAQLLAAVALTAAGLPLQRAGRRVASRIFPGVASSAPYEEARKRELYRSAVEGVLEDGVQDTDEAESLRALREELQIPMAWHREIMEEVRSIALDRGANPLR